MSTPRDIEAEAATATADWDDTKDAPDDWDDWDDWDDGYNEDTGLWAGETAAYPVYTHEELEELDARDAALEHLSSVSGRDCTEMVLA